MKNAKMIDAASETGTEVEMAITRTVNMPISKTQISYVKSRALALSTALTAVGLFLAACQPGPAGAPGAPGLSGAPTSATSPSQAPAAQGGSSDGGGFVSENSKLLLDQVSKRLASTVKNSSPGVFKNVPVPWNKAMIAQAIGNIRLMPQKNETRMDKPLMFNFGKDDKGPYLEALQPYFTVYGSIPIKFVAEGELKKIESDLELKLLHEAAHLWNADEAASEKFGMEVLRAFERDQIYCRTETSEWLIQRGRNRIFNSMAWSAAGQPGKNNFDWYFNKAKLNEFNIGDFGMAQTGEYVICGQCTAFELSSRYARTLAPGVLELKSSDLHEQYLASSGRAGLYAAPTLRLEVADSDAATVILSAVSSDGNAVTCEKIY